jgi:hypothetical protein
MSQRNGTIGERLSRPNNIRSKEMLADPATSRWLKHGLEAALIRDPVDALNDALLLAEVLRDRLHLLLQDKLEEPSESR